MKKSFLTIALASIIALTYSGVANAVEWTITKPTVTVNTSKEESALTKKINEIEKAKADAKEKQAAQQKANEEKKAQYKNQIEQTKADYKKQIEENKKEAKERQEQRKNAIDNFKKSFTTTK